jgi:hypothetical protein
VDALHQSIRSCPFFGSSFSVPGSAPEDFCGTIERSNGVFLRVVVLLLDVQPPLAPPLDGVGEFDVKVVNFRTDADDNAAQIIGDIAGAVAPVIENVLPQAPMRMGPEEALAQGDENRDMEDGVGGQLMQLNPVNKEKSTEKLMDGGGKAANEVIDKSYPVPNGRTWEAFVAGEDQRALLDQAKLLEGLLVLVGDFRSLPSRDLRVLHRCVGPWRGMSQQFGAWRHKAEL